MKKMVICYGKYGRFVAAYKLILRFKSGLTLNRFWIGNILNSIVRCPGIYPAKNLKFF